MKQRKADTLAELEEKGVGLMEKLEKGGSKAVGMGERKKVETERKQAVEMERRRDVKTTIKMPEEMLKALKHRAIDEGKTMQELVIEAVRKLLEE